VTGNGVEKTFNVSVCIWDPTEHKLFLVQRHGDHGHLWGLPGGGVHTDIEEEHLAAARREVKEETLMTPDHYSLDRVLDDPDYLDWGIDIDHGKVFMLAILTKAFPTPDYSQTPPEDHDIKGGDWIALEDYLGKWQFLVPEAHRCAIRHFLSKIAKSWTGAE